jgi:signal transduction histidine kinase
VTTSIDEQDARLELEPGISHLREIKRISAALHDLCQPLTTLQCRLEMAGMIGTAEAYREAVEVGLTECGRLADLVATMRAEVRAAREAGTRETGAAG